MQQNIANYFFLLWGKPIHQSALKNGGEKTRHVKVWNGLRVRYRKPRFNASIGDGQSVAL
jgi:hypothetical protein